MSIALPHEVRARIVAASREQGQSLAVLSAVVRRGERYMQRFVRDEVPYALADGDRRRVARFLGLDEMTLLPRPPERRRRRWA